MYCKREKFGGECKNEEIRENEQVSYDIGQEKTTDRE